MSLIKFLDIKALGDERGHLIALENNKNVPFAVKRVYYVTAQQSGRPRGPRANKELTQVAVCVSGRCLVKLDNGKSTAEVVLDSPDKAVIIDKKTWHELHQLSSDCVLLVLADNIYQEQDYIRNYDAFLELIRHA